MARDYALAQDPEFTGNKHRFFLTEEFSGVASATRECRSIYEKPLIPWAQGCDRRCVELLEDTGHGTWRQPCRWWQHADSYAIDPHRWYAEPAVPAEGGDSMGEG